MEELPLVELVEVVARRAQTLFLEVAEQEEVQAQVGRQFTVEAVAVEEIMETWVELEDHQFMEQEVVVEGVGRQRRVEHLSTAEQAVSEPMALVEQGPHQAEAEAEAVVQHQEPERPDE